MKQLSNISIFLFAFVLTTSAQVTSNPFEIVDRLETVSNERTEEVVKEAVSNPLDIIRNEVADTLITTPTEAESINIEAEPKVEIDKNNPFEIISRENSKEEELTPTAVIEPNEVQEIRQPTIPKKSTPSIFQNIEPKGNTDDRRGEFFALMLVTLIPISILFTLFRSFFMKAYENITSASILNRSYREYAGASVIPMNIWYVVFLINLGIFVSLIMNFYELVFTTSPLLNAAICVVLVSIFILVKRIILAVISSIFPVTKEVRLYSYLLLLFGIVIGVFLMPVNIAIMYANETLVKPLFYSALALLLGLYLLRSYRALIIGNRFLTLHRFHFLLYICAVELAPLFILIKLLMLYLG